MQRKSASRMFMAAISIVTVCCVLDGASALAQSDTAYLGDRQCSDRTLSGDYGFAVEGLLLVAPGVTAPGRGVTMTHFDGKGNLTQVDSLLINGSPISDWTPVTGTYHVNANCTGTMTLSLSTGGFVNIRMVVVKRGKEIYTVVWPPFDGPDRVVTSRGVKVD